MSRGYRQKYPEIYKRWKDKYYAKHNYRVDHKGRRYTLEEDALILEHEMSDVEIAQELERSVASIQSRRYKLNQKRKEFKKWQMS